MEECIVDAGLFSHDTTNHNPGIVMIESSLLDLGANPSLCEGIFYMLPLFHQGKLFVR